jgi:hypothetical protein
MVTPITDNRDSSAQDLPVEVTPVKLVILTIFLLTLNAYAKERPNQCTTPTSDVCYAQAIQFANLLKSKMKNPDTFKLQKVAANFAGDICFRYTAENDLSQPVNSVAIYYRKAGFWDMDGVDFDDLLGNGLINHRENNARAMQKCSGATQLDVERIRTAMSNSKQTDF